jgi:trehalose 6-phosphate phosphatase
MQAHQEKKRSLPRKLSISRLHGPLLEDEALPSEQAGSPPSALASLPEMEQRFQGKRVVLFLDYDGTLTPIVERPEDALLTPEMRDVLRRLATRYTVAIVSGRDRADVQNLVALDELIYAGSHGFDITGPGGLHLEQEEGRACLPDLDTAERDLAARLGSVAGARLERKRFALAVHYRQVADGDIATVEKAVDEVLGQHPSLKKTGGKKVFELRPNVEWDKGRAVLWLLHALDLEGSEVLPIYLGDDLTDEDAFRALAGRGLSIVVKPPHQTCATYQVNDVPEVGTFLEGLLALEG